ncbi:MAG: methylenetetrahydrofolate--tRNA-(uracil(54)-C(5))-methyltransferase (FADH(2)-oxidizing) TrmFO [Pseudomonadota bacterium]
MMKSINIIGAGLAGSEAALQLASFGVKVRLFEMKPNKYSEAHSLPGFAELVCSNSLKSIQTHRASGLLKEELQLLGSYLIKYAEATSVPAGKALAVDRELFSGLVTKEIENNPNIEVIKQELTSINSNEPTIIATGPLTSESFAEEIAKLTGQEHLYFFDSIAPIVDAESLDYSKMFEASRYLGLASQSPGILKQVQDDIQSGDYLNCPMSKDEYYAFVDALVNAELAKVHDFDKKSLFEGCLPVEEIASRGRETLAYGPLKPVGLGKDIREVYAVVQLRKENKEASIYNLVGFQTRLSFSAQKRVFRMIPGLEKAEFVRLGRMHKNMFINSPDLLNANMTFKGNKNIYFAGQISGVEGYVESIMSGLCVAKQLYANLSNAEFIKPPLTTICGSLLNYILNSDPKYFQPMNANFGILPKSENRIPKKQRGSFYAKRSLRDFNDCLSACI